MPNRLRILPYRQGSESARALANSLNTMCIKTDGTSRFVPQRDDLVINWGAGSRPATWQNTGYTLLNSPHNIERVSNKLTFFQQFSNTGELPRFWTRREDIPDEVFNNNGMVVCRTILNGHSGRGIVLARNRGELVQAQLYVEYIKKQHEFRFHLGRGGDGGTVLIDAQRKARDPDNENPNFQIRNHQNGFIFVREGIELLEGYQEALRSATRVFEETSLDFGAIDVIFNSRHLLARTLEVNTAPGLTGTTLERYTSFFQHHYNTADYRGRATPRVRRERRVNRRG